MDSVARAFMEKNFAKELKRLHTSLIRQIAEPERGADLFVAGIPCKPYSRQRAKRFQSGSVKSHASHDTLFQDFCPWLDAHIPKCGIFENVRGMEDPMEVGSMDTPLSLLLDFTELQVAR